MKKIMWIVAMIPVVVTSVVLQFMPDIIPMHHDLEGNTDRWGSKTESFIFPVIILFITLFWHLLIYVFEKKSKNANTEKEQMEAKSSAKVLCVVGISQAIMFGIMHYFILYSSWIQANAGGEHAVIDIAKVSCILCGIIFIVLGNFMTKAKRNAVVGVRTVWSMHNDNTWRRRAGHARAPAQGRRRIRRAVSYPVEQAGIIIFRLDFSRRVVYTVLT